MPQTEGIGLQTNIPHNTTVTRRSERYRWLEVVRSSSVRGLGVPCPECLVAENARAVLVSFDSCMSLRYLSSCPFGNSAVRSLREKHKERTHSARRSRTSFFLNSRGFCRRNLGAVPFDPGKSTVVMNTLLVQCVDSKPRNP